MKQQQECLYRLLNFSASLKLRLQLQHGMQSLYRSLRHHQLGHCGLFVCLFAGIWPLKVNSDNFDNMLVMSFVGQSRWARFARSVVNTKLKFKGGFSQLLLNSKKTCRSEWRGELLICCSIETEWNMLELMKVCTSPCPVWIIRSIYVHMNSLFALNYLICFASN